MTRHGRPLRFLLGIMGLWSVGRIAMLWPAAVPTKPAPVATTPPGQAAHTENGDAFVPFRPVARDMATARTRVHAREAPAQPTGPYAHGMAPHPARDLTGITLAMLGLVRFGESMPPSHIGPLVSPAVDPGRFGRPLANHAASRWAGSGWMLWRSGVTGMPIGLNGSILGDSQAGARISYAIDPARRITMVGRFSTPLSAPGRELALGIEWRPGEWPVRLVAEHRIPLDGGQGGPTLGMIGGVGAVPLIHNFRLESYGQAGVILRDGGVGFADGALRINRRVAHVGGIDMSIGGGLWGGIQPDAARLDVGPSLGLSLPVRSHSLRLSLDWRERVAGNAMPRSGPALTLGADF